MYGLSKKLSFVLEKIKYQNKYHDESFIFYIYNE